MFLSACNKQLDEIAPAAAPTVNTDTTATNTGGGTLSGTVTESGAEFSLLPPENATGNFTKITQRVPVKISVPAELADTLKPGLSVTVTLDTRDTGTAAK